jgi:hypothetical protein
VRIHVDLLIIRTNISAAKINAEKESATATTTTDEVR